MSNLPKLTIAQLVKQVEMKLLSNQPLNHTEIYLWDTVSAAIGTIANTSLVHHFYAKDETTGQKRAALCAPLIVGRLVGFCVYQDILEQEPFDGLRYFYFHCENGIGGGFAAKKPDSDEWFSFSISFTDNDIIVGTRIVAEDTVIYVDLRSLSCTYPASTSLCSQYVRS